VTGVSIIHILTPNLRAVEHILIAFDGKRAMVHIFYDLNDQFITKFKKFKRLTCYKHLTSGAMYLA
jgi:hypothetical protein